MRYAFILALAGHCNPVKVLSASAWLQSFHGEDKKAAESCQPSDPCVSSRTFQAFQINLQKKSSTRGRGEATGDQPLSDVMAARKRSRRSKFGNATSRQMKLGLAQVLALRPAIEGLQDLALEA